MKTEQIKKLLKGVMNKLVESIKDNEVREHIVKYSFITGGCIPSMIVDEYVNDYDIYLTNSLSANVVLNYYKQFHKPIFNDKQNNIHINDIFVYDDKTLFHPKLITENSINLSDKVQIVIKYYGEPKDLVDKFDWKHIKSYYVYSDNTLNIHPDTYRLIVEKELVYTGSDYPLSSLLRTRKFIKKGWTISTATMVHIALDIVSKFSMFIHKDMEDYGDYIYKNKEEWEALDSNIDPLDKWIEDKSNSLPEFIEEQPEFSKDEIISQLNGVDPLTVQMRLLAETKQYLTIEEILNLINNE